MHSGLEVHSLPNPNTLKTQSKRIWNGYSFEWLHLSLHTNPYCDSDYTVKSGWKIHVPLPQSVAIIRIVALVSTCQVACWSPRIGGTSRYPIAATGTIKNWFHFAWVVCFSLECISTTNVFACIETAVADNENLSATNDVLSQITKRCNKHTTYSYTQSSTWSDFIGQVTKLTCLNSQITNWNHEVRRKLLKSPYTSHFCNLPTSLHMLKPPRSASWTQSGSLAARRVRPDNKALKHKRHVERFPIHVPKKLCSTGSGHSHSTTAKGIPLHQVIWDGRIKRLACLKWCASKQFVHVNIWVYR